MVSGPAPAQPRPAKGRDYYVQSPRAITEAVAQHGVRMRRIDETIREADAIIEAIQTQLDARSST